MDAAIKSKAIHVNTLIQTTALIHPKTYAYRDIYSYTCVCATLSTNQSCIGLDYISIDRLYDYRRQWLTSCSTSKPRFDRYHPQQYQGFSIKCVNRHDSIHLRQIRIYYWPVIDNISNVSSRGTVRHRFIEKLVLGLYRVNLEMKTREGSRNIENWMIYWLYHKTTKNNIRLNWTDTTSET